MLSTTSIFALAALAVQSVSAWPSDLPYHQMYKRADAGDSRSPCPALNTAANVGALPRDGKNISADDLSKAIQKLYHIGASFADTLASQGVDGVAANGAKTIALGDLSKHGVIEHDASISRLDVKQGDNTHAQPALVEAFLNDAKGDYITINSIAKTRNRRAKESEAAGSPALGIKQKTLAYGEAALLLHALGHLGNGTSGYNVPKQAIREWILDEKLPTGWKTPPTEFGLSNNVVLSARIEAATYYN